MIRGTTPKHIFTLKQDPSIFKEFIITYQQYGKTVIEKRKADCEIQDNSLVLTLTQEETLKFEEDRSPRDSVRIQIKALTTDGKVFATEIKSIHIQDILNEEVMS